MKRRRGGAACTGFGFGVSTRGCGAPAGSDDASVGAVGVAAEGLAAAGVGEPSALGSDGTSSGGFASSAVASPGAGLAPAAAETSGVFAASPVGAG
jgi:hypothetical protein